ncbi:MAG: hypothetical protein QXP74_00245 [Nitrososphaerota archaeon]
MVGVSRCIIGFGETDFTVDAGFSVSHQPFSSAIGSSLGIPVPYGGVAKNLKVIVSSNTLDDVCKVSVYRNEVEGFLNVIIPAGVTGVFENNIDTMNFNENDRIFFVIDTTNATTGSIKILGASVVYEVSVTPGVSRCIIGFGEAGFIVGAGWSVSHQPFSSAIGSSLGIPVPYRGMAMNLKVIVLSNSLDNVCKVSVYKNEEMTNLSVTIPAGETGTFKNDTDIVKFDENDRIYFVIDTSAATSGSIDIPGVTIAYEG